MVKIYHCNICGRDMAAHTNHDMLKKVRIHSQQKHNISEFSSTQLHAIRRKIESSLQD